MNDTAHLLPPDSAVLAHFGVSLIAPLGSKYNKHWHAQSRSGACVLRQWGQLINPEGLASVQYEVRLMARLAELGWPVPFSLEKPVELMGHWWSLAPFLPGEPTTAHGSGAEQRKRGRLLAELHRDMARIEGLGQRPGWRRCEEILADPELDTVLSRSEHKYPEEVSILRWHLERARLRIAGLSLSERPGIAVHGDFTPWNLHFAEGQLSGILDFELTHRDHRIGDFALVWRGKYDEVVFGYDEVSPLEPEEWALLTPLWWAGLIEGACRDLQRGTPDDGWTIKKLLERSSLMGPDAVLHS